MKLNTSLHFILIAACAAVSTILIGMFVFQLSIADIHRYVSVLNDNELRQNIVTESQDGTAPDNFQANQSDQSDLARDLHNEYPEMLYGHFRYDQIDESSVIPIASYGIGQYQRFEFLAPDAATALFELIYSARHDGVWILPASAFRSIKRQEELFGRQVERRGSVESAARSSAPPGYSEHHTGLAVDLADGNSREGDISMNFVDTEAFIWLQRRASEFGFEMSFSQDNPQNIMYEPWHWRYVGSPEAAEIFSNAYPSSID